MSEREKVTTVYVAVPIAGLSEGYIQEEINKLEEAYKAEYGYYDDSVQFVTPLNNVCKAFEEEPTGLVHDDLWLFGSEIHRLADCDEAIFSNDWATSKACRIIRKICHEYAIPIMLGDD